MYNISSNRFGLSITILALFCALCAQADVGRVINVSEKCPRYFADDTGKTWIPIGCNICFVRPTENDSHVIPQSVVRERFERWLTRFAENGGNCIRLWGGHTSLEVMPDKPNVWDKERTETLKGIIKLCEKLNIKVKITFESFRWIYPIDKLTRSNPAIFNRPLYAPYAKNMMEFLNSEECYKIYMQKAAYLKSLGFGDSPAVYCWELWNEINCIGPIPAYAKWSDRTLADLKVMFPRQMTVQNLGSFSDVGAYQMYDQLVTVKDNDFLQIHRYLDAGACLDVCRGPMDIVGASATRELLDRCTTKPAIVAEIGAVKANHAGPCVFYAMDKEGVLLHDEIFAPFFAGSAGCGQPWHWDQQYIDGNNLWWQFKRFAKAIEGLDPAEENFRPFYTESRRLRMYGLKGTKTAIVWCRDKRNAWEDEFVHGEKVETLSAECVPFRNCTLDCYLPFEDKRVSVKAPKLPPFRRSIVVRVPADAIEGVIRYH